MGLGGLWHGANWNFVAWGIYQGVLLIVERAVGERRSKKRIVKGQPQQCSSKQGGVVPFICKTVCWLFVQYLVFLGWLIFRVGNWEDMVYCVRKYVFFDFDFDLSAFGVGRANPFLVLFMMLLFVISHSVSYRMGGFASKLDQMHGWTRLLVYVGVIFALITLWPTGRIPFIYFQF
jgi:D-alanyl-lipoteichoic acid acyltransferase DltB (MBOAT superfamily)